MNSFITLANDVESEQVIKKSRFIGRLIKVSSMEDAQEKISAFKKQFWDATHNCSAIICGNNREYMRSSDDGEPQGTAGVPMLEALKGSGITDVLAIVTRYYGGIMLGAGGLVRAYSGGVSNAVAHAQLLINSPFTVQNVTMPYTLWGKVQNVVANANFIVENTEFTDNVTATLLVSPEREQEFLKLISEVTMGKVAPIHINTAYRQMPYVEK